MSGHVNAKRDVQRGRRPSETRGTLAVWSTGNGCVNVILGRFSSNSILVYLPVRLVGIIYALWKRLFGPATLLRKALLKGHCQRETLQVDYVDAG